MSGSWMMRYHFWDVHQMDLVKVPKERKFPRCRQCRMQVDPWTIVVYVATRLILTECRQGEQKRGAVLHRWWWEQQMDLDVHDATGSDK